MSGFGLIGTYKTSTALSSVKLRDLREAGEAAVCLTVFVC